MPSIRVARPSELDAPTMYEILRLRVDVFVVEQECPYPELDGRDLEPDALWLWVDDEAGRVIATLRVLRDLDGRGRIGRVATATSARSSGQAGRLMERALTEIADRYGTVETVLDAQAHLARWYARFGFVVTGAEYLDDGIPHVPMSRPASPSK